MLPHTDIPTRAQLDQLLANRHPMSVSIYVPTDPVSANVGERIEMSNLASEALDQLRAAQGAKRELRALEEELGDLIDDETFWRFQARSLATFATPDHLVTFRLPNRLVSLVETSDRFHRAPIRRIQGSEGRKVRLRQYARQIDQALRPFLNGLDVPLILAATEPLESIFRSVNSYPHLAAAGITGNPERASDAELAAGAREVLDGMYADELRATHDLFDRRAAEGRAMRDIVDVARAATHGAIDTVMVDIDEVVPGSIDEQSGQVTLAQGPSAAAYGVVDEIARRVWLAGGRVLALRRDDIPGQGSVAAILRYAL